MSACPIALISPNIPNNCSDLIELNAIVFRYTCMIRGVHWRSHQRHWRAKTQSSTPDRLKHAQTRIGNKRCVPRCFCHTSLLYRKLKTLWRLSEIQHRSLKAVYLAAACVRVFSNSRLVSQAVFVHPWEGPKPEQGMKTLNLQPECCFTPFMSILVKRPNRQM